MAGNRTFLSPACRRKQRRVTEWSSVKSLDGFRSPIFPWRLDRFRGSQMVLIVHRQRAEGDTKQPHSVFDGTRFGITAEITHCGKGFSTGFAEEGVKYSNILCVFVWAESDNYKSVELGSWFYHDGVRRRSATDL